MVYQIRQCVNEGCRFRFPALAGIRERCPTCGDSTAVTTTLPHTKRHPITPHPANPLPIELLLDNIRSLYNVGSIFRTADGAGVSHLHLCGITATPEHPKLAKTALGAEGQLSWSYSRNGVDTAVTLQNQGYQLWALENTAEATSLFQAKVVEDGLADGRPILLIVGNENVGIDPAILTRCDQIFSLPMQGIKDSLNVAVAFGIALYHIRFGGLHGK
jgi:tRNA G18 (ribose-2'-O)-methylase SpoU